VGPGTAFAHTRLRGHSLDRSWTPWPPPSPGLCGSVKSEASEDPAGVPQLPALAAPEGVQESQGVHRLRAELQTLTLTCGTIVQIVLHPRQTALANIPQHLGAPSLNTGTPGLPHLLRFLPWLGSQGSSPGWVRGREQTPGLKVDRKRLTPKGDRPTFCPATAVVQKLGCSEVAPDISQAPGLKHSLGQLHSLCVPQFPSGDTGENTSRGCPHARERVYPGLCMP
jgi:hypothetical protein